MISSPNSQNSKLFSFPHLNKIIIVFFITCAVLLLVDVLDPIGLWTFKHHAAGDGPHADTPRYHYGIEGR